MKRTALLSTLVAIAAVALFASSSAQGVELKGGGDLTGVMYEMWDPMAPEGILRVANTEGDFIEVFAADGAMVWAGHVPENYFELPCPNHGVGPEGSILSVLTSTGAKLAIDRDEDWIWE